MSLTSPKHHFSVFLAALGALIAAAGCNDRPGRTSSENAPASEAGVWEPGRLTLTTDFQRLMLVPLFRGCPEVELCPEEARWCGCLEEPGWLFSYSKRGRWFQEQIFRAPGILYSGRESHLGDTGHWREWVYGRFDQDGNLQYMEDTWDGVYTRRYDGAHGGLQPSLREFGGRFAGGNSRPRFLLSANHRMILEVGGRRAEGGEGQVNSSFRYDPSGTTE